MGLDPSNYEFMTDDKITFYLQVCDELCLADACLVYLRRAYPSARIMLVTDGDDDPCWQEIAACHSCELTYGRPLYRLHEGGKLWHRILELFFLKPTDYLCKIDPDTKFWRQFTVEPTFPVSGTVITGVNRHVQGGCKIVTQKAATKLFDSDLFLDPCWSDANNFVLDNQGLVDHLVNTGLTSEDHLFGAVVRRLGIEMGRHPEVRSSHESFEVLKLRREETGKLVFFDNPETIFAATHQHKWLDEELLLELEGAAEKKNASGW